MAEKRFDVSVYLLKPSQVPIAESSLFSSETPPQALNDEISGGKFLALPVDQAIPKWAEKVQTLLASANSIADIFSQTPGGILWIPRKNKHFAFSFGRAHTKLKDEWLVPEFGKKVALNVIPQGQVVEVRAEQVFAKWHIASERAPRAAAVHEFGFEADRDLVSAVEGVPSAKYIPLLGAKVRGGTALKFGMYFSKLLETLDEIAERFDSGDYKTIWPQVDNLIVVRDETQIKALDNQLDNILTAPKPGDKISLAAPSSRSGDKPYPQHFVLGRMVKNYASSPYLLFGNWESYLSSKGNIISLSASLDTPVHLLDENKDEIDSCSIYQCFGAEVSLNGQLFILSSGVWYEAKLDFINATNQVISKLVVTSPPHSLPKWNQVDDEGTYNAEASKQDNSLWLFDKKLVHFGGGKSKFEFCDLMHLNTKTLYFVKQPSGSASLSHLCEQVRRTAENFFSTDNAFRSKLAAEITKQNKNSDISWLTNRPNRHEWNLCLVSMGKPADQFPFFAKCGITRLVRELHHGAYNLSFQAV